MQTVQSEKMVRKQILISPVQVKKLDQLAHDRAASVSEVIRLAIDAYDAGMPSEMEAPELMDLVSTQLKETIKATKKANQVVAKALLTLSTEDG